MSNQSFPFDAVKLEDGTFDRYFNSADFASYFGKFIGNGVYANKGNALQVQSDNTSMFITIKDGACFIRGRALDNTEDVSIRLENSDDSYTRIDNVVAQLDLIERELTVKVITGTPSANPVAPTLTRDDDVYELLLATVQVDSGVTTINQAKITDKRSDTDVCGWVTGLLDQIETTSFFEQYQLAFNQWFTSYKNNGNNDMEQYQLALNQWFNAFKENGNNDMAQYQQAFETWFETIKDVLDEETASKLYLLCENLDTNKANKSSVVDYTILASAWSGTTVPYTYTVTMTGVTPTSMQELIPSTAITQAQLETLQNASIVDGGQANNTIYLKAWGDKPTIDIPVRVILRGDI